MLDEAAGARRMFPVVVETADDGLRDWVSVLVGRGGDEVEGHGSRDGQELRDDEHGGEHDHAAADVGPLSDHCQASLSTLGPRRLLV